MNKAALLVPIDINSVNEDRPEGFAPQPRRWSVRTHGLTPLHDGRYERFPVALPISNAASRAWPKLLDFAAARSQISISGVVFLNWGLNGSAGREKGR